MVCAVDCLLDKEVPEERDESERRGAGVVERNWK